MCVREIAEDAENMQKKQENAENIFSSDYSAAWRCLGYFCPPLVYYAW